MLNAGQERADSRVLEPTTGDALHLLAELHPRHSTRPAFKSSTSTSPPTSVLLSPRTAMPRSRPDRTGHSLRSTVVWLNNWQEPSTLEFHTPTASSATVGFCVGAVGKSLDEHIDTSPGKLVTLVTRSATAFLGWDSGGKWAAFATNERRLVVVDMSVCQHIPLVPPRA